MENKGMLPLTKVDWKRSKKSPKEGHKQGIDIQEFERKANEIIDNVKRQETLEEALSEYIKPIKYPTLLQCAEFGAKWQAEKMYSEEEVKDLLLKVGNILESSSRVSSYTEKRVKEWFEQFKKNNMENKYPTAFLTKAMCLFYKSETEVTADGTPRYIPNPNAKGTYSLKTCMSEYTPIYGEIKI